MRPDVCRPDVGRPDVDPPGVDPPDVEPGRFANIMSAQGDHAFKWFTAVEPAADSTAVSPCGAPPQTLYTTLLSDAASNSKDYEFRQCGKSCTMANIKRDMVSHLSRTENTKCLELYSESSDQRVSLVPKH